MDSVFAAGGDVLHVIGGHVESRGWAALAGGPGGTQWNSVELSRTETDQ